LWSCSEHPAVADGPVGVEDAENAGESGVRTHDLPEDDVPDEYLDKETILSRTFCQREPYLKTGVARFGSDLNITPVLLHNSLHSVQA
jgi:hypothetical protein